MVPMAVEGRRRQAAVRRERRSVTVTAAALGVLDGLAPFPVAVEDPKASVCQSRRKIAAVWRKGEKMSTVGLTAENSMDHGARLQVEQIDGRIVRKRLRESACRDRRSVGTDRHRGDRADRPGPEWNPNR